MKTSYLGLALCAGVAISTMTAAAASAAVYTFEPGIPSPGVGYLVVDDFNSGVPANLTGTYQIKTPPADSNGAPPANSFPAGTPYLSVLGGDSATIALGTGISSFEFDWGSIDSYNTLVIHSSDGDLSVVPGVTFPNAADGNQFLPGTNGLFKVVGSAGETFSGFTLNSSANSFEIDNVAVLAGRGGGGGGVPEPASWALMIVGFGGAGMALRRRRGALAV